MDTLAAKIIGWGLLAVLAGWVMWKAIRGKGVAITKK